MINGIIYGKLQTLDKTLVELRSLGHVTREQLNQDWRTRKAIERNLQILTEIVIDVCQRILALANQTPATTSVEAVQRCVELKALCSSIIITSSCIVLLGGQLLRAFARSR